MFRIRDDWYGSGSLDPYAWFTDPACYFRQWLLVCQQKISKFSNLFCLILSVGTFTSVFKDKGPCGFRLVQYSRLLLLVYQWLTQISSGGGRGRGGGDICLSETRLLLLGGERGILISAANQWTTNLQIHFLLIIIKITNNKKCSFITVVTGESP